jgi:hypothetical protein
MTEELWQRFEDIKNDFEKLRFGNQMHLTDKELNKEYVLNQMRVYAKYSGHLNWKVLNRLS